MRLIIYWRFPDEKFFGKNESGDFMERLKLLPPEQVAAMEGFVERKMEGKEGGLVDWYEPGAESKLPLDILSVGRWIDSLGRWGFNITSLGGVRRPGPLREWG